MMSVGARVRREIGDQMRQYAELEGTTPGALVRKWVLQYVREHGGDLSAQQSTGRDLDPENTGKSAQTDGTKKT